MFFPCTNKEKVLIDEDVPLNGWQMTRSDSGKSTLGSAESFYKINGTSRSSAVEHGSRQSITEPQYISKPTIIMCNPNALYY